MTPGVATEAKVDEVVRACRRYGDRSIVALSGVPGTGKSHVAGIAAGRVATTALMVREVQFHPTYSYEEFMEGYRADPAGGFRLTPGTFLEWNAQAADDAGNNYVLLVEELTRANLPGVLGELLTYLEHRDRPFYTLYGRMPVRLARNLTVLATFNPLDRSAIEMDDALVRRLRVIDCPPDTGQLAELPGVTQLGLRVVAKLVAVFDACRKAFSDDGRPEEFTRAMPFGHAVFADIRQQCPDLHELWTQRLVHFLWPPGRRPHPLADIIAGAYPWRAAPDYRVPGS